MLPFAPPLTSVVAARWVGAAVPPRVTRWVLTAGWAAAFAAAVIGDSTSCTPDDPSVCGPDQVFAWVMVLCLATPVLLLWLPLLGCAAGVAFAASDVLLDNVLAARVGFGLHGVACAVVGLWLVRAAGAQRAIVGGSRIGADARPVPAPDSGGGWLTGRVGAAVALSVAGAALLGWYTHVSGIERGHEDRAVRATAQVVAVDDEEGTITLAVPADGAPRRMALDVVETVDYPKGSAAAVRVDPGDPDWVRLVAEPQDDTFLQTAGFGALLLALLAAMREVQVRRARRWLRTGDPLAVRVWIAPDEAGDALVFPDDGARPHLPSALPVARVPLAWTEGPDADREADDDGELSPQAQASFGRAWRGEGEPDGSDALVDAGLAAEPALLVGDLRERGWATVLTQGRVCQPEAPLRLLRAGGHDSNSDEGDKDDEAGDVAGDELDPLMDGRPVAAAATVPADLPLVLTRERAQWWIGLALVVLAPSAVVALLLLVDQGWGFRSLTVLVGANVLLEGTGRLVERVRLTHTGLEVVSAFQRHVVPWERLHGVRRKGATLAIAWQPDIVAEVGPFAPASADDDREAAAERAGAMMLALRNRVVVDGAQARPSRTMPGPVWAVWAGYAAVTGLLLWHLAAS